MEEDHNPMQARTVMAQTLQIILSWKQPKNQEELRCKGNLKSVTKEKTVWLHDQLLKQVAMLFSSLLCYVYICIFYFLSTTTLPTNHYVIM